MAGDLGNGSKAFVPRAEDVVITKLRWSKQGRRQKDVDDVVDDEAVFGKTDRIPLADLFRTTVCTG